MIKLYDWLSQDSLDLDYSLNQAGFSGQTIVINENGFLPEGMTSPYAYFCGFENQKIDVHSILMNCLCLILANRRQ